MTTITWDTTKATLSHLKHVAALLLPVFALQCGCLIPGKNPCFIGKGFSNRARVWHNPRYSESVKVQQNWSFLSFNSAAQWHSFPFVIMTAIDNHDCDTDIGYHCYRISIIIEIYFYYYSTIIRIDGALHLLLLFAIICGEGNSNVSLQIVQENGFHFLKLVKTN